ncbi:MAG TPA: sigma-54 dependent transcriptional regulator [Gemmata sp.]|nr:sigma-54 dependent transcriptional regulator [Gemmata sp.]
MDGVLLLGSSLAIAAVRRAIEHVADTDATVLLQGETGVGKELAARLIHSRSRRAGKPLVVANCGALVPTLAVSELFGHEPGAFTGAIRRRVGKFESAQTGSILLDEVGELPAELQPLLLRVLEEQVVERLGGEAVPVNVRVIAATNRDLAADVKSGRFRADLFYRLNVFPIVIPPLRDRREDIPELAMAFVREFASAHQRPASRVPGRVLQLLAAHDWPGNIRELRNVIERAVILSTDSEIAIDPMWHSPPTSAAENGRTWAAQEKARILDALREAGGRIYGPGGAAHRLGLRPTTLYGKMRKHGIAKDPTSWQ